MKRNEVGDRFNRIMEDMEHLMDSMQTGSDEKRHMSNAKCELLTAAKRMGFTLISKEQHDAERAKKKPKLQVVK